jgi:F420-dependent oxidoreductase-like protein
LRIGIQVPSFTFATGPARLGPALGRIAHSADAHGFYSFWVMDHFFQIPLVGPAEQEMLEGYTALAFCAGITERIRLGTMVTGVTYRHPGLLAKTVSTLDVLSEGRAYLGIGAAWFDREHAGLGVPFPPMAERFERLEETLQIAKQMFSDDVGPYEGRHYQLAETLNSPPPVSRPHPPILIGGGGEKKTLRLVAQYGDACNLFQLIGDAELARKLDVLRRHCDDVGRDYDLIDKTVLGVADVRPGKTTTSDLVRTCEGLAKLGFQHAIFSFAQVDSLDPIERVGREVIPEVGGL